MINSIATGITIGGGLAKDEGSIVGAIVGGLKGIGEVIAEEINEPEGGVGGIFSMRPSKN